jgi:hypothetical protein
MSKPRDSFSIYVTITFLASASLRGRLEWTRNYRRRIALFFYSIGILIIICRYILSRFSGKDTRASSIAAS